jgi:hypothetical protein
MYTRTSPPRNTTIPFEPVATSPKSVVWGEPQLLEDDCFDQQSASSDDCKGMNEPPFERNSLAQISSELQTLVKKSARSKASYHGNLRKMTSDLQDATRVVQVLEQELNAAREKQVTAQRAIDRAKQKRGDENERLLVRKLQLQILRKCMAEPDFVDEIQQIREQEMTASSLHSEKYDELSFLELSVVRRRLEDIMALLDKSDAAKSSKAFETRANADSMKREAISTFILFHKYSQI